MIPISEIEKIIETLNLAANKCAKINMWDKYDAYSSAVYLLKELLPK